MRQTFEQTFLTAQGKVAIITLNHGATINALSTPMVASLHAALDAVENEGFLALILTGAGRGFCSGADMKELASLHKEGAGQVLERVFHPLLRRLIDLPMPLITAINGPAVGIGVSLALMGDLTVAARSSYFQLSFLQIGLVPDGGATFLLPRLIGLARARELALLAERLPAERALGWGLINRVVDDAELISEALKLANQLAKGPASLLQTRKLLHDATSYEAQLVREADAQQKAGATDDFAEGLAAFLEKREPQFGRK